MGDRILVIHSSCHDPSVPHIADIAQTRPFPSFLSSFHLPFLVTFPLEDKAHGREIAVNRLRENTLSVRSPEA